MTEKEFDNSITRLYPVLLNYSYYLTSNKDDARDLLQDAYIRAYEYDKNKRDNIREIRPWMFTIVKNTCRNNHRGKKEGIANIMVKEEVYEYGDVYSVDSSDSECYMKDLWRTINSLDKLHRVPFKLHIIGYKHKEISDLLNITKKTSAVRTVYAKKKLKELLSDYR
jgi:RNA polymerase sigma-70 factor (ECF subfamily)